MATALVQNLVPLLDSFDEVAPGQWGISSRTDGAPVSRHQTSVIHAEQPGSSRDVHVPHAGENAWAGLGNRIASDIKTELLQRLPDRLDERLAACLGLALSRRLLGGTIVQAEESATKDGPYPSADSAIDPFDLQLLDQLQHLGLLTHAYLPLLGRLCRSGSSQHWAAGAETELRRLALFFHAIACKRPNRRVPLLFRGPNVRLGVVMVAKPLKPEQEGTAPYLRAISKHISEGAETLLILTFGARYAKAASTIAEVAHRLGYIDGFRVRDHEISGSKSHLGSARLIEATVSTTILKPRRVASSKLLSSLRRHVPEISAGEVEIAAHARIPGHGSKVSVRMLDDREPAWKAVNLCLGQGGSRLRAIRNSLEAGEFVRFLPWSRDVGRYLVTAMLRDSRDRAAVQDLSIDPSWSSSSVLISDPASAALAVGRSGLDLELTSQLLGINIQVRSIS